MSARRYPGIAPINPDEFIIVGIDPGAAGGIVVRRRGLLGMDFTDIKMPSDIMQVNRIISDLMKEGSVIVYLEKINARHDDLIMTNGVPNMGKIYRIQKMLANYERLKVAIELTGAPVVMVHPATWQASLGLNKGVFGESKTVRKNRYKEEASRRRGTQATLWNADAYLISEFGIWTLQNPKWLCKNLSAPVLDKILSLA